MTRLVLALAVTLSGSVLAEELIRWTDENGEEHYTNDPNEVPARYRRTKKKAGENASISVLPAATRESSSSSSTRPAVGVDPPQRAPNESYWRQQFQSLRERIDRYNAEISELREIEQMQSRTRAQRADGTVGDDPRLASTRRRLQTAEQNLRSAEDELRNLNERAAAENVPQGWR